MLRHPRQVSLRTKITRAVTGVFVLLVIGPFAPMSSAGAAAPTATVVDLGTAASYSVLAGAGVANTGDGHLARPRPRAQSPGVIAGFPPGHGHGTIHDKDAAAERHSRTGRTPTTPRPPRPAGTRRGPGGSDVPPGVYTSAAAVTNTRTMTLDADGDSNAVFVFQIGAAFSSAAASKVVLTNGALANNVYWQVLGAVSLGAGASRRDVPRGGCGLLRRRRRAEGSHPHAEHRRPREQPDHQAQGRPDRAR